MFLSLLHYHCMKLYVVRFTKLKVLGNVKVILQATELISLTTILRYFLQQQNDISMAIEDKYMLDISYAVSWQLDAKSKSWTVST